MTRMLEVRPRLDWFVDRMRAKLAAEKNQAKSDWRDEPLASLAGAVEEEWDELKRSLLYTGVTNDEDANAAVDECADIANRAMMLADAIRYWRERAAGVRARVNPEGT